MRVRQAVEWGRSRCHQILQQTPLSVRIVGNRRLVSEARGIVMGMGSETPLLTGSAEVAGVEVMAGTPGAGSLTGSCAHLWSKDPEDPYPLLPHLLDTAVVIGHLWDRWLRPGLRDQVAGHLDVDRDAARDIARLIAGLHDLGKANPFFQLQERRDDLAAAMAPLRGALNHVGLPATRTQLLTDLRKDHRHALRRHEYHSFRAIAGRWPDPARGFVQDHWLAAVDGGHHGFWRPALTGTSLELADWFTDPGWDTQQQQLLTQVADAVGLHPCDVPNLPDAGQTSLVLLSGLLTLADWLASDDERVAHGKSLLREGLDPHDDPVRWMAHRDTELAEHVAACVGSPNTYTTETLTLATLGDYQPRPLQEEALGLPDSERLGGLWVCMYPTGEGKSEATMLRHALRPGEGFLFGLPTRATTDAMERRVSGWLAETGHGVLKSHQFAGAEQKRARLRDDDTCCDLLDAAWFTSSIRKLVGSHVVMTCDQLLVGALRQRHATLRLLGLANHHVVIDEIHTFDRYQQALLVELLAWWGRTGTRVTLLSATLPRRQMEELVAAYRGATTAVPDVPFPGHLHVPAATEEPMTVGPDPDKPSRAPRPIPDAAIDLVEVTDRNQRIGEHVRWATDTARAHPCSPIGVISNIVDDCCAIATGVRDALAGAGLDTHDVECLHSRMIQDHRTCKEALLLDRIGKRARDEDWASRRPTVVVGTQVMQASLDIDLDFLATDLAPAPDLLQRLGRQWRFGTPQERAARIGTRTRTLRIVAVCQDGTITQRGALPYPDSVLSRTHAWLRRQHGRPLDILGDSQDFVDAAYRPATVQEIEQAEREIAQDSVRTYEAGRARANLQGLLRRDLYEITWSDLAALAEYDDEDSLMRTRYIDVDTVPVLLFDSTGRHSPLPPLPDGGIAAVSSATGAPAADLLGASITLPGSLRDALEAASFSTCGRAPEEWDPASKMLAGFLPIDMKYLEDDCTYTQLTGLTRN